ncbi:hypothetical protein NIES4102_02160 [Chondrocystis sp. NIES-4102]|nr:hypothetical protein NIES4102_02160 [Chondrocystis sp. NIES-4102]
MSDYELQLKQAISHLYKTFESYHLNPPIAGCPCCVGEYEQKLIRSKILNQLTVEDLNHYVYHAVILWGTIEDFKHFLPRLLELTAFEYESFWSDIVIIKIAETEFNNWKEEEREVVNQYLLALWNYILSQPPRLNFSAKDFINSLSNINNELKLFLTMWSIHHSPNSLLHLSDFIGHRINLNKLPIKINYFSQKDTKEFLEWVLKEEVIARLEQYFFNNIDEPYIKEIADTIDILNYLLTK